jgi:hypothetical protein
VSNVYISGVTPQHPNAPPIQRPNTTRLDRVDSRAAPPSRAPHISAPRAYPPRPHPFAVRDDDDARAHTDRIRESRGFVLNDALRLASRVAFAVVEGSRW